jgi:hypothetical protein
MLKRHLGWIAALAILSTVTATAKTTFSSVWKSPEASRIFFGGLKVAAVVIDQDESLRVAGEEALADELNKRGMQGVPSYRFVPKELLKNPDQARGWFEKSGVQGVIAFRLISDQQRRTITPATWSSAYYSTLWGYYGYGWGTAAVFTPGSDRTERFVSLETLVFSVPRNTLIWAGVSTSDNPKSGRDLVEEVVREAVKEMEKQGLTRKGRSTK